jgi:hypothetical protein
MWYSGLVRLEAAAIMDQSSIALPTVPALAFLRAFPKSAIHIVWSRCTRARLNIERKFTAESSSRF